MKKKIKDKQTRSRQEVESTTKSNYLPPSPPISQKKSSSMTQQHYQSSSSPVGRPPPPVVNFIDTISDSDQRVLEDLKAFLVPIATAPSSTTTFASSTMTNQQLVPDFIQEEQLDIILYEGDMSMFSEKDEEEMNFFPALPPPPPPPPKDS